MNFENLLDDTSPHLFIAIPSKNNQKLNFSQFSLHPSEQVTLA